VFKEDALQFGEAKKVAIMSAKASDKFPDTLDGVEIGAIRRKEEKGQKAPMFMEPSPELSGVVPSGGLRRSRPTLATTASAMAAKDALAGPAREARQAHPPQSA